MYFDVETIAQRFAERPGYRFITYRGVGIAVFAMNLRTLSIEPRTVPPIQEFIIKLMMEGIESLSLLSNLLGIEQDVIHDSLVELRRHEVINVLGDDDSDEVRCVLTSRGKTVAQSLQQDVMLELTLPDVIFHGLLRQPVDMGSIARHQYLRPKEAREQELDLIRAIPNRHPYPSEIDVDKLDRVTKQVHQSKTDHSRDIVAVKSVLKNARTLYEPAVMIEYETIDGKEKIISFIVEGRLRSDYEEAFVNARGPELLADLIEAEKETIKYRVKNQASPNVLRQLGRFDDAEELAAKVVAVHQEVIDKQKQIEQLDRADTRQRQHQTIVELKKDLAESQDKLEKAQVERNERKVKYLWTPEIRSKLWEAINTVQDRLLILSGFISSEVLNPNMVEELRAALKRGVKIWIGYGMGIDSRRGREQRSQLNWKQAEMSLAQLQSEFPDHLVVKDIGRNHEKRLICDNSFTFGGSFNLLSFSGERRGSSRVRHEGADLIENPDFCEELWRYYISEFFTI